MGDWLWNSRAEKVHEKMGSFVLFPWFLPELVLKLSKKVNFLQFCADLSQKPKSVIKAIYIYGFESFHYSLSENDMVYWDLSHHSWDISNWNIKNDADSAEI